MLDFSLEQPYIYILFCVLLGLAYSYFLYIIRPDPFNKKIILSLFCIRTLFVSAIAFLLLNPVFESKIDIVEKPILVIAKDNSQSIKDNIDDELYLLKDNMQDFQVFSYSFADVLVEGIVENNDGLKTNYSRFFSSINSKFENRNIAGVILASDGCYNSGSNPEYLSYDFPVYSIALGDTNIYKDVRIDNLLNNDIAFLGNTFPLEVSFASNMAKDHSSIIRVFNSGVQIHEEHVFFSEHLTYDSYLVNILAENVGLQTYTVEVDHLDGEMNVGNNMLNTYIDIIDYRSKILLLKDRNSPDLAAYKSTINDNKNYEIEVKDVYDDIQFSAYDLLVIFGVDEIPTAILNSATPLIIFNAKSSHYTDIKSSIGFTQKGAGEEISIFKNRDFSKFIISSKSQNLILQSPPLFSIYGKYDIRGKIDVLLNHRIEGSEVNNPVIMIEELDSRKIAFLTAEGWWRWRLYDYLINHNNIAFDELFSKLTQFMVLTEDKSLFRLDYEKQYEANDNILLRAQLYNDSYELITNKEIALKLFDEEGRVYEFQFVKQDNMFIAVIGVLEAGRYNFTAHVNGTNMENKGYFDVKSIQLEQLDISANHQVLHKIANLSDGKVFYPSSMSDLEILIKGSDKNRRVLHFSKDIEELIDIPLLLLCLIILISIEWFARKYNGFF